MKTKLFQLVIAATLLASPLAFAVEPEKGPGKDSTSTTVPNPNLPKEPVTDPASTKAPDSAGTSKNQGKDSTSTDVAIPPKDGGEKKTDAK